MELARCESLGSPIFTMAKEKTSKAVRRLGVRYGRTVREKIAAVETLQKQKHRCPYCTYQQIERVAAGIWHCRKCNSRFSSGAYYLTKPATRIEELEIAPEEAEEKTEKTEKGVRYREGGQVIE